MTDPSAPPPDTAPRAAPRPHAGLASSPPPRRGSAGLGILALVLAVLATLGASAVGALASWRTSLGAGAEIASRARTDALDLGVLAPVRDWVMLGEASFWTGTAVGLAALAVGIVAIVKDRGRVPAIVAVVAAALGPVVFFVAVSAALQAGYPVGAGIGG